MSGSKAIIALALAVSVGVLAVIAATLYLEQRAAATSVVAVSAVPPPIPTKDVVVLTGPVKAGEIVGEDSVKVSAVPLHLLEPGHIVNTADLLGRRFAVNLEAGVPVLAGQLVPRELDTELAGVLADGFRGYSVSTSSTGEVAGFVLPGNRVDVLVSGTSQDGRAFSRVVAQDIKVLAVAQDRFVQDRTVPRPAGIVTLEVTPSQAEMLDMARSVGTLSFALRAQSDRSTVMTLGARQEELHGIKPVIEVIRGSVRSVE